MKQELGWWFPDAEQHLQDWMRHPKNRDILNSRMAYQGKKQIAAMRHCRDFRTAVDVGGHIGTWSYNLAEKFEHVYAFEPVEDHRRCFMLNVAADNVTLYSNALGDQETQVGMYTSPTSSGDSWVHGSGTIPMRTLDSFDIQNVDFMKIDCEGFEENVLKGAVETIKRCKPTIIVEQKRDMATKFGLRPLGAVELLKGLGYTVAEEISGDYICVPK